MLAFKRALMIAALLLTILFYLRSSHTSNDPEIVTTPGAEEKTPGEKFSSSYNRDSDGAGSQQDSSGGSSGAKNPQPQPDSRARPKERPFVDTSKMSLYDKLAYQFPYDAEEKFPAYIWQTWKFPPDSNYFNFKEQEKSWSDLHPGFVHEVITDDVAGHLLRVLYASVPEVLEAYDALPEPVLKADFFRYLILLARGGIYSDIDTMALKSTLVWVPESVPSSTYGLVVGIEADPDRPDWKDWYSRRIQFCQWTIQSKAGHPVLRDIVTRITKETLKRQKAGLFVDEDHSIVEFTGPAIWTDSIFDYFNDARFFDIKSDDPQITWKDFTGMENARKVGDVVVLPITSFSPGVQQMGAKEPDDPMAFVQHDFEGTWKPENLRHIGEYKKPSKKNS